VIDRQLSGSLAEKRFGRRVGLSPSARRPVVAGALLRRSMTACPFRLPGPTDPGPGRGQAAARPRKYAHRRATAGSFGHL